MKGPEFGCPEPEIIKPEKSREERIRELSSQPFYLRGPDPQGREPSDVLRDEIAAMSPEELKIYLDRQKELQELFEGPGGP